MTGCLPGGLGGVDESVHVWGKRGLGETQFQKPRAVTIGPDENLYIVDMTGRIKVFDQDGNFFRCWRMPHIKTGKPCGLSVSNDGLIMVADTHNYRVLFYTPEGELVEERTIGGENGTGPGQFGFVTDVVQDSHGNYYVSEYGDYDRIQKFDPQGTYLCEWGGHGEEPGKFLRPQGLVIDEDDQLWVADASNHRIQVFDVSVTPPKLVRVWGENGREYGKLAYPYDLFLDGEGHIYVCEFGTHRIQKFTLEGEPVGVWGEAGREVGQLHQPWGMCRDEKNRIHVLDSYNHRIQRLSMSQVKKPMRKASSDP